MISSYCRSVGSGRNVEAFPAGIELIKEFTGVLARKHLRGVHSGVHCYQRFPRAATKIFAQGSPRALSVS